MRLLLTNLSQFSLAVEFDQEIEFSLDRCYQRSIFTCRRRLASLPGGLPYCRLHLQYIWVPTKPEHRCRRRHRWTRGWKKWSSCWCPGSSSPSCSRWPWVGHGLQPRPLEALSWRRRLEGQPQRRGSACPWGPSASRCRKRWRVHGRWRIQVRWNNKLYDDHKN